MIPLQFQGREYRNFPSLFCPLSEIDFPYSGFHPNPPFIFNGTKVHGYDIGETLAYSMNRDEVIKQKLGFSKEVSLKKMLKSGAEIVKHISLTQELEIQKGQIIVQPLEGVIQQLDREKQRNEGMICITHGTYQMARSYLHGANLEKYVHGLISTEERNAPEKDFRFFSEIYSALNYYNIQLMSYCDDSLPAAITALEVSRRIKKTDPKFKVFLIKRDACNNELGPNSNGLITIRSINEKEQYLD